MSTDPNDVVRLAAGEMMRMEMYKNRLADEGIEARVLGESLEASFGSAIANSIELWVHRSDAARAATVIQEMEAEERGKDGDEEEE